MKKLFALLLCAALLLTLAACAKKTPPAPEQETYGPGVPEEQAEAPVQPFREGEILLHLPDMAEYFGKDDFKTALTEEDAAALRLLLSEAEKTEVPEGETCKCESYETAWFSGGEDDWLRLHGDHALAQLDGKQYTIQLADENFAAFLENDAYRPEGPAPVEEEPPDDGELPDGTGAPQEPPECALSFGGDEDLLLMPGNYEWSYPLGGGEENNVIACGMAPLGWAEDMPAISGAQALTLSFELEPEKISVQAWYFPTENDDPYRSADETISVEDGSFAPLSMPAVYAITAEFSQGRAEYCFRISGE